ncbi:MAG: TadE/TadG family type IV pilus assembly protein [Pseudomonadota bacterium]|nr:TadE/TadG family type IV pilus assembly protein [Pseudomonadota bacterium]
MRFRVRRLRQRGAELVEFAVVLPLALIILFGIIEVAVAAFDQAILTNASRVAAREAIRGATEAEWTQAAEQAAQFMVKWNGTEPLDVAVLPDPSTAEEGTALTATATYPFGFFVLPRLLDAWPDITLSASTVMRVLPHR